MQARKAAKFAPEPEPRVATEPAQIADDYISKKLLRVRKQLARLDDLLDEEDEPALIDRLASAIGRLSEIERNLAGRPLPGSRKPAPDRPDRRQSRTGIMLDDPAQPPTMPAPNPQPVDQTSQILPD